MTRFQSPRMRRLRQVAQEGIARKPFLHAQPPRPDRIRDPLVRELITRIVKKQDKRVMTPQQLYNLIVNAQREWVRVRNVEELARMNGKNNYLSVCLETERRLAPLMKENPSAEVQKEWNHAQHVLGLFRDPAIIYFGPLFRKKGEQMVILIGKKAPPRKVYRALARRMLESEEEYFLRLARGPTPNEMIHKADARERAARRNPDDYKIHFHALDPITKKFRPIYGKKKEYPEYNS